ncbi:predicted protein [Plenodomus lingam JN3]|uniref:Predicted protein n=1 Tax=Leptosphaeria maculans (strain JN3 / isolate v23.1.3 / race Av1-4-5-6-7-8) TaxID=985895 RepID=E5R455_LEPMJ|nr:predicted protein [Plenodomus lingam JN3]CBX91786.1 predicted protein [Plenodomus lingam JN3]
MTSRRPALYDERWKGHEHHRHQLQIVQGLSYPPGGRTSRYAALAEKVAGNAGEKAMQTHAPDISFAAMRPCPTSGIVCASFVATLPYCRKRPKMHLIEPDMSTIKPA